MQTNTTKAKLKAGEAVFGCFTRTPDASLVELLGYQGWDFLIFDGEHGLLDVQQCENMVRAAELRRVTPIVRVPANEPHTILRYLDTGAQGIQVPHVDSGPQGEAALRSIKYYPRGDRGLAGVRAANYAQDISMGEYVKQANAETLTIFHIETAEAVQAIGDILALKDLDVVFIGPNDLSHSLGLPGEVNHPTVQEHINRVIEATLKTDVALGMIVRDSKAAQQVRARGARYIVIGIENVLGPACRNYLAAARG